MRKILLTLEIIGAMIIGIIIFFMKSNPNVRNLLVIIIFLFMVVPAIVYYSGLIREQKEKEQKFLEFVRDIVENVRSGTPISKAIVNIKNRDYGALKPHVIKLANQVSMGIPLTKCLETFAYETKSPVIGRSVNLISEASRSGGEMNTILSSVASSVNQTEIIQKERRAAIFNLVIQGYIIFFVFIIIILVLEFFLMPLVKDLGPMKDLNIEVVTKEIDFSQANFLLLLVQSFFSGLVIGKISEGKINAGIKHSFILVSLALILSSLATVFFG
jgi:archaeal flagellar protein FlaJ